MGEVTLSCSTRVSGLGSRSCGRDRCPCQLPPVQCGRAVDLLGLPGPRYEEPDASAPPGPTGRATASHACAKWHTAAPDAVAVDHTPVAPGETRVFASIAAAIAQAAHDALVRVFRSQAPRFDELLGRRLDQLSDSREHARGVAIGSEAARTSSRCVPTTAPCTWSRGWESSTSRATSRRTGSRTRSARSRSHSARAGARCARSRSNPHRSSAPRRRPSAAARTGRLKRSDFGVNAFRGFISDDVEFTVKVPAAPASTFDDQMPPAS